MLSSWSWSSWSLVPKRNSQPESQANCFDVQVYSSYLFIFPVGGGGAKSWRGASLWAVVCVLPEHVFVALINEPHQSCRLALAWVLAWPGCLLGEPSPALLVVIVHNLADSRIYNSSRELRSCWLLGGAEFVYNKSIRIISEEEEESKY